MAFADDGTGYAAMVEDSQLLLARLPPEAEEADLGAAERIVLDPAFPGAHDFVQDLRIEPGDRVVATRWSGIVHVIEGNGQVSEVRLPEFTPEGLYYTAVLTGDRLCATFCADISVACGPRP